MQDYKFSILIANYNNGKFFKDCYESILNQTYTNWEVVIIDDASTDNSVEIIKNIIGDDKRFRLFINENNAGVGFTKGKLIDLAEGEICGFLDPDDIILPKALKASVSVFKKSEEVVLTYSKLAKCDSKLNPLEEFKSAKQVPNGDLYFFNCPIQIAPFVGFRKSSYLKLEKMNAYLRIAEDQDLYLKLYEIGKVKFINQIDYYYRQHHGGISQNNNKKSSYTFWAETIFNAMKRRGIKEINSKKVPETYSNPDEIFKLLEYQNSINYRILKKFKTLF